MSIRWMLVVGIGVPVAALVTGPETPEERVETIVHESQSGNDAAVERLRLDFQKDPARLLRGLVERLGDGTVVQALPSESSMYTVCGNALTLLEDLTDLRLDDVDREWIGFRVHDHRGWQPTAGNARARWNAWLHTRAGIPVEHWFHGLSARELHVIQRVLRAPASKWTEAEFAPARALGARANAFLMHALLDEEWACEGERMADQANRLLARVNGGEPEPVERHELLTIDPADPLRAEGTALVRNRIGLHALHERWSVRLLTRK